MAIAIVVSILNMMKCPRKNWLTPLTEKCLFECSRTSLSGGGGESLCKDQWAHTEARKSQAPSSKFLFNTLTLLPLIPKARIHVVHVIPVRMTSAVTGCWGEVLVACMSWVPAKSVCLPIAAMEEVAEPLEVSAAVRWRSRGSAVFVTGRLSPVSVASCITHSPYSSSASHVTVTVRLPFAFGARTDAPVDGAVGAADAFGWSSRMMSPGTRDSLGICLVAWKGD